MVLINKKINNKYWILIASVFSCVGVYAVEAVTICENSYRVLIAFQSQGIHLYRSLETAVIDKEMGITLATNKQNPFQSLAPITLDYRGDSMIMYMENGIKLLNSDKKAIGMAFIWNISNPKEGFDKVLVMDCNEERKTVLPMDLKNPDDRDSRIIFMTGMRDLQIFRPGDEGNTISVHCNEKDLLKLVQQAAGDTEHAMQVLMGSTLNPDATCLRRNEEGELELNTIAKKPKDMITPLTIAIPQIVQLVLSVYAQDQNGKSDLINMQWQYLGGSEYRWITTIKLDDSHRPDDVCGVFAFLSLYLNNISKPTLPVVVASYLYIYNRHLKNIGIK